MKREVTNIMKLEAVLEALSGSLMEETGKDRLEVEFKYEGKNGAIYRGAGDLIKVVLKNGSYSISYCPRLNTMNQRDGVYCVGSASVDIKGAPVPAWLLEELSSEWKLSYVVKCFRSAMRKAG